MGCLRGEIIDLIEGIKPSFLFMKANGSRLRALTTNFGHNLNPDWSPDGRTIVFDHYETTAFYPGDLFLINADGTGLTELYESPGDDWGANWQPLDADDD